jgi:hypothetical protein
VASFQKALGENPWALERAIAKDPNNPIPHHFLLGLAYRDSGQAEDADRELKLSLPP